MTKESKIIEIAFRQNETVHIQNPFKYPIKITVAFNKSESVSFICIIGGSVAIKCGAVPPVVTFDEVDSNL